MSQASSDGNSMQGMAETNRNFLSADRGKACFEVKLFDAKPLLQGQVLFTHIDFSN
jgi:hypothetical protein